MREIEKNQEKMFSRLGLLLSGRLMVREYPFESMFLPKATEKIKGETHGSDCDHCNRCIAAMYSGGVYCVSEEKGLIPYPDHFDEN